MKNEQLDHLNLYLCRECDQEDQIYIQKRALENHINTKHTPKRNKTNLELATHYFYDSHPINGVEKNHWEEALNWLQNIYEPSPPPFRQSLITKIQWRLEESVINTFREVIIACVEANHIPSQIRNKNTREFDSTPFWYLTIIFEQLILGPKHPTSQETINQCIHRWLRLFRSGQIKTLYEESRQTISKSSKQFQQDPSKIQKSAQLAADNDNYKSANARLTKTTPVAPINDNNIKAVESLFPESLNLPQNCTRRTRSTNQP